MILYCIVNSILHADLVYVKGILLFYFKKLCNFFDIVDIVIIFKGEINNLITIYNLTV